MYVPAGITTRSLTTNGNAVSAYTGSPSLAVLVEIACFSDSGTLVPAGMISVAFPDSAEGAAGVGADDDCAAAIPAKSKADTQAARLFIETLPLQNNLAIPLQFQMRPVEYRLAEKRWLSVSGGYFFHPPAYPPLLRVRFSITLPMNCDCSFCAHPSPQTCNAPS